MIEKENAAQKQMDKQMEESKRVSPENLFSATCLENLSQVFARAASKVSQSPDSGFLHRLLSPEKSADYTSFLTFRWGEN